MSRIYHYCVSRHVAASPGDDAQAKASVSAFIKSCGLRPQDTGDLSMAHWLEGVGLLSVGVGRYGVGDFNFSLGVNFG